MSGHIMQEALIMVWRLFFQNNMRRKPTMQPPKPEAPAAPKAPEPPTKR
jgi:hypothetical protein